MKLRDAIDFVVNTVPNGRELLRALAPYGFVTDAKTDQEICVATRTQLNAFNEAQVLARPSGPPRGCLEVRAHSWGDAWEGGTIEVEGRACFVVDVPNVPLVRRHLGPPACGIGRNRRR